MSKQDLKSFSKSDLLGFASAVPHGFLPPEGDLTTKLKRKKRNVFMISKSTIPYIGTEILLLTKNDHNSTQNAPKSIIPGRINKKYDIPHHLTVSNQDLKHFSKSDILGFAGAVFHGFLPPEGDLTTKLTM